MIFDDEQDIIDWIQHYLDKDSILLFNNNKFEKRLLYAFRDKNALLPNNGHDKLPPDYYSTKYDLMFDVTRVNASEMKKTYNPIKARERQMEKEILDSGIMENVHPDAKIICSANATKDDDYSYTKYLKNVQRVIGEHIKKIPLWKTSFPKIKTKGLLVFDESECCFEGILHSVDKGLFAFGIPVGKPLVLHEPWNDENFMKQIYASKLDFVVWACTYKPHSAVPTKTGTWFPSVVLIDVRFPRKQPYIQYDVEHLVL